MHPYTYSPLTQSITGTVEVINCDITEISSLWRILFCFQTHITTFSALHNGPDTQMNRYSNDDQQWKLQTHSTADTSHYCQPKNCQHKHYVSCWTSMLTGYFFYGMQFSMTWTPAPNGGLQSITLANNANQNKNKKETKKTKPIFPPVLTMCGLVV